jgi:heat shock protein HtpX
MYSQIDKNKRLTIFLLTGFTGLVVAFTYVISYAFGGDKVSSLTFGFIAFILSLASGLFSYYAGASLVLAMTGAIDVTDNPAYEDLNQRIDILSTKAGIPKPRVHILPDQALNAFATGRDPKHGHIAVTQGLIAHMSKDELEAVIAHELGHIKNFDIRLMLIVSVLAGVLTYLADFFLRGIFYTRGDDDDSGSNPIALIVGIVFAVLAPIIATLIQLAISRRREYLADMTAVEITRYPQSMINALKKLQADDTPVAKATSGNAHMFIDFPLKNAGGFLRKLFSTHPPIEDRIAALEKL